MTAELLLQELAARGIRVWAEADWLKLDAPVGSVANDLLATLRARKADLLALLSAENFAALYSAADEEGRILLDERAAILEFDAGLSREEAERQAAKEWGAARHGASNNQAGETTSPAVTRAEGERDQRDHPCNLAARWQMNSRRRDVDATPRLDVEDICAAYDRAKDGDPPWLRPDSPERVETDWIM